MAATPLEKAIENALEQVRAELMALATAQLTGTLTIHCAVDGYQVEVNKRHKKIARETRDPQRSR
jgi:hypothetical protein